MKTQQIIKTEKVVIRKNKEQVKDFMVSSDPYNPDKFIGNFAKDMERNGGKPLSLKLCEDYQKVAMALGLDTHLPIADSVAEGCRLFLVNMVRDIEREYDCKTVIEKILAEAIASSHVRMIHLSKVFNAYTVGERLVCKEKTGYHNMIGKELDRAHRQLNNAILTLRQVKAPPMSFNVNAKTAFIAQNQQINNYDQ